MSYIITGTGLTIVIDNKPYTISNSHVNYDKIIAAVKANRMDKVPELINISISLNKYSRGLIDVDVNKQVISYRGVVIHNCIVDRIFSMMEQGFNINPMVKFLENLMANPSKQSVEELYMFMEWGQLPITEDGCFIAYKRVTSDYLDCYSRKVLNKPYELITNEDITHCGFVKGDWCWEYTTTNGVTVTIDNVAEETIVSMLRNTVDDKRDNTCSEGLHFCSHQYLKSFSGGKTVLVKINPADVVSIPSDYNNTKGRACKYVVVSELDADQHRLVDEENILTTPVYGKIEDCDDLYGDELCEDDIELYSDHISTTIPRDMEYVRNGYNLGYREGRAGYASRKDMNVDVQHGYDQGYSDGRGHKRKLYK